jgi:hypothetical protein
MLIVQPEFSGFSEAMVLVFLLNRLAANMCGMYLRR